jgi:hypothetical protein
MTKILGAAIIVSELICANAGANAHANDAMGASTRRREAHYNRVLNSANGKVWDSDHASVIRRRRL